MDHEPDTGQIRNPQKFARKYAGQPWWVLVLIATLPPLATAFFAGFFSYRASVVESKMKAAEAKRTAEAGYDVLVKAVDLLQKHDDDTAKQMSNLSGQIDAIEKLMRGMTIHASAHSTHLDIPTPVGTENLKAWHPTFPAKLNTMRPPASATIDLPKSLDEAVSKSAK